MKRGQVYYLSVGDNIYGGSMRGGRPVLIVSNDKYNATAGTVTVVSLTTQTKKDYPTHVKITSPNGKLSTIACENIETVQCSRLGDLMMTLPEHTMKEIDAALRHHLECNVATDTVVTYQAELPAATTPDESYYKTLYYELLDKILAK